MSKCVVALAHPKVNQHQADQRVGGFDQLLVLVYHNRRTGNRSWLVTYSVIGGGVRFRLVKVFDCI